MLSTSYLLGQMDILEAIKVENLVQSKVDFDSPVLYYLNSYLLKTPEKELLKEGFVNSDQLPIHDRFIYNCLLENYKLQPQDERDLILSEVYSAMHVKEYVTDMEKANELERLFHKMKKNNIEQEASPLLSQLWNLHKGKPLEAVYKHLYKKYNKIQKINTKAFDHFIALNGKLNKLLENDGSVLNYRSLIVEYKSIRYLNERFENNNLSAILKLSKLMLVSICKQEQLLKATSQTVEELVNEVFNDIQKLAFGIERFYLNNILNQINLYVNKKDCTLTQYKDIKEISKVANNFGFPKSIIESIEKEIPSRQTAKASKRISLKRVDKKINSLVINPFSSLSIHGDSLLVRSNI